MVAGACLALADPPIRCACLRSSIRVKPKMLMVGIARQLGLVVVVMTAHDGGGGCDCP